MQPSDVLAICADTSPREGGFGFKPVMHLRTGLRSFARWNKKFYKM